MDVNANRSVKKTAKGFKTLAVEYDVHVNTIYRWRDHIALLLNLKKGAKKLSAKQVEIFYGYYGEPAAQLF